MMLRLRQLPFAIACCLLTVTTPSSATKTTYNASLTGREALPPVETKARGQAQCKVEEDVVTGRLHVVNGGVVSLALMNMASPGQYGSTVVVLYRTIPEGERSRQYTDPQSQSNTNSWFTEFTIRASRLVGPLDGGTIADLVAAMDRGDIYISVATEDGEIRGRLE